MPTARLVTLADASAATTRRCSTCHRLTSRDPLRRVPRRDWQGRCGTCRDYKRRHARERPYRFDGRRERTGQLPLPLDL